MPKTKEAAGENVDQAGLDETLREGARLRGTLILGGNTVEFDFY